MKKNSMVKGHNIGLLVIIIEMFKCSSSWRV